VFVAVAGFHHRGQSSVADPESQEALPPEPQGLRRAAAASVLAVVLASVPVSILVPALAEWVARRALERLQTPAVDR
jgi:hypothetical protein